jgi:hypothetical protein
LYAEARGNRAVIDLFAPRARQIFAGPGTVTGHASAGGAGMADVEFLNREAGAFLDGVTEGGKKLN